MQNTITHSPASHASSNSYSSSNFGPTPQTNNLPDPVQNLNTYSFPPEYTQSSQMPAPNDFMMHTMQNTTNSPNFVQENQNSLSNAQNEIKPKKKKTANDFFDKDNFGTVIFTTNLFLSHLRFKLFMNFV